MLMIPEQTRYTTELTELSDDPRKLPEVYAFLPSLRRSLRLSAAAKCSPILGTDYIQDDNSWQPTNFDVKLLGHKKLLTFIGDPNKAYTKEAYVGLSEGEPASTYPGWPKYGTGLWELRNYQVIDLAWIQSLGRYCYSHSVFYEDDQLHWAPYHDNFDNNGKLWKVFFLKWAPMNYHGVTTLLYNGYAGNANFYREVFEVRLIHAGTFSHNGGITAMAEKVGNMNIEPLDTTDIDKWVGKPVGGGQLKELITLTDIRRSAQGMQNVDPLYYDEKYAAESAAGEILALQSFTVNCTAGLGTIPAIQGYIPGTHMLFGGDEWWFYGPGVGRRQVRSDRMLLTTA